MSYRKWFCWWSFTVVLVIVSGPSLWSQEDEFAANVRAIYDPDSREQAIEYMKNVDSKEMPEAPFWYALGHYLGKLKEESFTTAIPFYAENGANTRQIHQMFENAISLLPTNSKFYWHAYELKLWCILRQAELARSSADQKRLMEILQKELALQPSDIAPDTGDRLDVLLSVAGLRLASLGQDDDQQAQRQILEDLRSWSADAFEDEIHKAYFSIYRDIISGRLSILAGDALAVDPFGGGNQTAANVKQNFANSLSPEEALAFDYYRMICTLFEFAASPQGTSIDSLQYFAELIAESSDPLVRSRLVDLHAFLSMFDSQSFRNSRRQVDTQWWGDRLSEAAALDFGLKQELPYWLGWADFLKTDDGGTQHFANFFDRIGHNLPQNLITTDLTKRIEFLTYEAVYRIGSSHYGQYNYREAKGMLERIHRIRPPVDFIQPQKIYFVSDLASAVGQTTPIADILPAYFHRLKYVAPYSDMPDNTKREYLVELATHFVKKGSKQQQSPRAATRRLAQRSFEVARQTLTVLLPDPPQAPWLFNYSIYSHTDGVNYDVRLPVSVQDPLYAKVNILMSLLLLEESASVTVEAAESTLNDALQYVDALSNTDLALEGRYVKGFILYALGKTLVDNEAKRLYFERALFEYAQLFDVNDYVGIRSLYWAGMCLKEPIIGRTTESRLCFQKILAVVPNKLEAFYKLASEELQGSLSVPPPEFTYDTITFTEQPQIRLRLNQVKYLARRPNQITLERLYGSEKGDPEQFLWIWQRYSMPVLSVPPSTGKNQAINLQLYPIFN